MRLTPWSQAGQRFSPDPPLFALTFARCQPRQRPRVLLCGSGLVIFIGGWGVRAGCSRRVALFVALRNMAGVRVPLPPMMVLPSRGAGGPLPLEAVPARLVPTACPPSCLPPTRPQAARPGPRQPLYSALKTPRRRHASSSWSLSGDSGGPNSAPAFGAHFGREGPLVKRLASHAEPGLLAPPRGPWRKG